MLSLANRLLARAAPGIAPSRSVRPDGDPPDLHRVAAGELVEQVADHAVALVADLATVAVIAMPERVDELRAALEARGVVLAEPGEVEPDRPIVVVPAPLAKGLEFDGVIVVEPAEIAATATTASGCSSSRSRARCSTSRSPTYPSCRPGAGLRVEASRPRSQPHKYGQSGYAFGLMNETTPRLRITRRSGKVRVVAEPGAVLDVAGGSFRPGRRHRRHSCARQLGARGSVPGRHRSHDQHVVGRIEVRGDAGSVKVITKSGALAIERATAVNARGASGRVEVGACAGECHVVFVSGNVHIGEAGRAVVATVSGNIEVGAVDDAEVKTVSGKVTLGARGGGRLAARAISGSVSVSVPAGRVPRPG